MEEEQAKHQAAPLRGKRENEIQSIDGVRTALQLMDEMNGLVAWGRRPANNFLLSEEMKGGSASLPQSTTNPKSWIVELN